MGISPTSYKVLANGLFSKIQTLGIKNITEEETYELVFSYIRPACIKFRACKQNLKDRDNTLQSFNIELIDDEIEILCNLMLIEWLSTNFINVPLLLKQSLPSKDVQVFSKKNHLDGLVNLRDTYKRETDQMISAYSNSDSDLFAILKSKMSTITPPIEESEDIEP